MCAESSQLVVPEGRDTTLDLSQSSGVKVSIGKRKADHL